MELKSGNLYSRREISDMLGGSIQAYLPYRDDKVLCGCFVDSEEYNPGAPEEVLFGREVVMPIVEATAEMVYEQGKTGEAVPIFIKRESAQWEYLGNPSCYPVR